MMMMPRLSHPSFLLWTAALSSCSILQQYWVSHLWGGSWAPQKVFCRDSEPLAPPSWCKLLS
jgi:hypothetical protein